MKRTAVLILVLLSAAAFAFGGPQGEKKAPSRPIWIWLGAAWQGNEWDEASLAKANEWALKKFGATFKITAAPQGSTFVQALNLLTAQGEFPDLIATSWLNGDDVKKTFSDLASQGKLRALDKYFNDPKNYPSFSGVDKGALRPMLYKGKIYAFPGWNIQRKKDDPWWGGYMWNIRLDVLNKYGAPTTFAQLYDVMKKVKADAPLDLKGEPTIPFGIDVATDMWPLFSFLNSHNGAGFEVDAQKRLMPQWAGQEFYQNLKWLNTFWREGLMDPGQFVMDNPKYQENLMRARYALTTGGTWNISIMRDSLIPNLIKEKGKDSAEVKEALSLAYYMMVHPTQDKPGRIIPAQPGYAMVSAQNPNPDATMKLFDWYISDEGVISTFGAAGILGEDWEWVDPPLNWNMKGKPGNQTTYDAATGTYASGTWADAKKAKEVSPKMLPAIMYVSQPTYSSVNERLFYGAVIKTRDNGFMVGGKPGEPTAIEWGLSYCKEIAAKVASPTPSYLQVIADIPPLEGSAIATASQRLQEGVAKVVTADSEAGFEAAYKDYLKSLIAVTPDWKSIYEARQKRWVDWLASNKIDDRGQLKTSTPVAEWKAVMGW